MAVLYRASAMVLVLTVALVACRSKRRASADSDAGRRLTVTPANLLPSDRERAELTYELTQCSAEPVTGVFQDNGRLLFVATDFAPQSTCELRVRGSSEDARLRYLADVGVLYWAKSVMIRQGPSGELEGTAHLQKVYEVLMGADPAASYQIGISFTLPEERPADALITGQLTCEPALPQVSEPQWTGADTGTLLFLAPIGVEQEFAQTCTSLHLFVDGAYSYHAGLPETARITARPGPTPQTLTTEPVVVEVVRNPAPGALITVKAERGDCPDGSFDTATRNCE